MTRIHLRGTLGWRTLPGYFQDKAMTFYPESRVWVDWETRCVIETNYGIQLLDGDLVVRTFPWWRVLELELVVKGA